MCWSLAWLQEYDMCRLHARLQGYNVQVAAPAAGIWCAGYIPGCTDMMCRLHPRLQGYNDVQVAAQAAGIWRCPGYGPGYRGYLCKPFYFPRVAWCTYWHGLYSTLARTKVWSCGYYLLAVLRISTQKYKKKYYNSKNYFKLRSLLWMPNDYQGSLEFLQIGFDKISSVLNWLTTSLIQTQPKSINTWHPLLAPQPNHNHLHQNRHHHIFTINSSFFCNWFFWYDKHKKVNILLKCMYFLFI